MSRSRTAKYRVKALQRIQTLCSKANLTTHHLERIGASLIVWGTQREVIKGSNHSTCPTTAATSPPSSATPLSMKTTPPPLPRQASTSLAFSVRTYLRRMASKTSTFTSCRSSSIRSKFSHCKKSNPRRSRKELHLRASRAIRRIQ